MTDLSCPYCWRKRSHSGKRFTIGTLAQHEVDCPHSPENREVMVGVSHGMFAYELAQDEQAVDDIRYPEGTHVPLL